MEQTLLSIFFISFILGIKHAIEPDHVIAVSTITSKTKNLWRASLTGVYWAIGHTATLFIAGMTFIIMKNEISVKWSMTLEFLVGIMLVYLGVTSFLHIGKSGWGKSRDESKHAPYMKSLGTGFIHGLAGSAAMIVLTMTMVETVWQGGLYIIIFGLGTVIGMLLFTTVISIPFILSMKKKTIHGNIIRVTGLISIFYGFYYMYNLGFTEGLFKLW